MKTSRTRWILRGASVVASVAALVIALTTGVMLWPILVVLIGAPCLLAWASRLSSPLASAVGGAYAASFLFVMVRSLSTEGPTQWVPQLALAGAFIALFLAVRPIADRAGSPGALRWMVLMFAAGLLVAYFSGGKGGANTWLDFFTGNFGLTVAQAEQVIQAIRKTLHFCFYGLVGLSAAQWARHENWAHAPAFGLAWALMHATFDEARQTFYLNRQGSAWDVLLDMAGAAAFIALAFRRRKAR
jgi:VanZ family protein